MAKAGQNADNAASDPMQRTRTALPDWFGTNIASPQQHQENYKVIDSPDLLSQDENLEMLSKGGVLFWVTCKLQSGLNEFDLKLIDSFINLSSFEDEVAEAGTIKVDPRKDAFSYWRNTAVYHVPRITPKDVSATRISSVPYQKACQPPGTTVWEDVTEKDTFRMTKKVIPMVYQVTIQFKCSDVPEEVLPSLSMHTSGLPVHKAILLERTRRTKSGFDICKKCKALLLYHFLPGGGALLINPVLLVNTSIPSVIVAIMDRIGSFGAREVLSTAINTRKYFNSFNDTAAGTEGDVEEAAATS